MIRRILVMLNLFLLFALMFSGCAAPAPAPAAPTTAPAAPTTAPAAPTTAPAAPTMAPAASTGGDLGLPDAMAGKSWDDILKEAKGQTVNFYHWGGSDVVNKFYQGFLTEQAKALGITLKSVPIAAPTEFVEKILNEHAAGVKNGSIDIVWINGENFRTVRQADALYGPFAEKLPNAKYIDFTLPAYQYDFGTPIEGYESTWLSGQMVLIYNTVCAPDLPVKDGVLSIQALKDWIIANPGKFTYTSPPEFTATAFLTPIFYTLTGGMDQWQGNFDQTLFDQKAPAVWAWLNEIEPSLWRKGETYPETLTQLDQLYANGEVCFTMNYGLQHADNMIKQGRFPATLRTFVFDEGTVSNWNFIAIPENAANLAGALAMTDLMLSPEVQYAASDPDQMASVAGITLSKLPKEWQDKWDELPRGEATLPPTVLAAHQVGPVSAQMLPILEQGWEENVLKK